MELSDPSYSIDDSVTQEVQYLDETVLALRNLNLNLIRCTSSGTTLSRGSMQSTNPKQLRAELKDYLDLAAKEPIRIQRRSGDSFILLKEVAYEEMQQEILSLQRRLLGMSDVISGNTQEYKIGDRSRLTRLTKKK